MDFYEWKAIKAKGEATIRHEGRPAVRLRRHWENWKTRLSGEWIRTFAVITTDANEMVLKSTIACRSSSARRLRPLAQRRADPRDLMRPFPSEPMRMWPISTRVNKPENDEPSIPGADRVGYFGCLERTSEHILIP